MDYSCRRSHQVSKARSFTSDQRVSACKPATQKMFFVFTTNCRNCCVWHSQDIISFWNTHTNNHFSVKIRDHIFLFCNISISIYIYISICIFQVLKLNLHNSMYCPAATWLADSTTAQTIGLPIKVTGKGKHHSPADGTDPHFQNLHSHHLHFPSLPHFWWPLALPPPAEPNMILISGISHLKKKQQQKKKHLLRFISIPNRSASRPGKTCNFYFFK